MISDIIDGINDNMKAFTGTDEHHLSVGAPIANCSITSEVELTEEEIKKAMEVIKDSFLENMSEESKKVMNIRVIKK